MFMFLCGAPMAQKAIASLHITVENCHPQHHLLGKQSCEGSCGRAGAQRSEYYGIDQIGNILIESNRVETVEKALAVQAMA